MRQMKTFILVGLLGMFAAAPASADWFFGAKTGPMIIDVSGSGVSDPVNTGVVVGYDIGAVVADLALEAEITTTTGDGKISGDKVDLDTQALYLAIRTGGPIYFKAKGGFLQVDGPGGTDSGASYGIGVGFGIGIAQLELEYTQTSVDPDLAFVSVGVQF